MYEVDGIVYAGNQSPIKKVIFAEYCGNHNIQIAFNTGEVVNVDFSRNFDGPAFVPLKNEDTLKSFKIHHGTLAWLDGEIDVAPEYLLNVGTLIQSEVTA